MIAPVTEAPIANILAPPAETVLTTQFPVILLTTLLESTPICHINIAPSSKCTFTLFFKVMFSRYTPG